MSDPLLSSLCSICHVKSHKYRCPRCSTLTCSLPCIKRHKQWAECNGIRDPTVYIKHRDLATPKGIDHDYNYLISIEREIDHAERNAKSRGVILAEDERPKWQQYEKGEKALENAFERCGVIVARAPKGISRSKQNATKLTAKTRTLRWTVEWVLPDGVKSLGMCSETQPIFEAYAAHLNWLDPIRPAKRRKPNQEAAERSLPKPEASQSSPGQPPSDSAISSDLRSDANPTESLMQAPEAATLPNGHKPSASGEPTMTKSQLRKRRRKIQFERATLTAQTRVDLDTEQQLQEWKEGINHKRKAEEKDLGDAIEATNGKERLERIERDKHLDSDEGRFGRALLANMGWQDGQTEGKDGQQATPAGTMPAVDVNPVDVGQGVLLESTSERSPTEPAPEANIAFYLHHPSLPSRHPVLIPLCPTSTLATSLTNRLVLEFPTIYVLHQHPDEKLPENFISEEDFFRMAKKELVQELEEGEVRDRDDEEVQGDQQGLQEGGDVDEKRLLDVLGEDLKEITNAP